MYHPISATPGPAGHRPPTPGYPNEAVSAQAPEVPGVTAAPRNARPCLFCRYRQAGTRDKERNDA